MFITLLVVTFVISLAVAFSVAQLFDRPLRGILGRILSQEISLAWQKYMKFAIFVVGISNGVRVWELERYITPIGSNHEVLTLNTERWVLEIYRTLIGTLQGIAWMLLAFFLVALLAYVMVRIFELRKVPSHNDV
jgi:hypothetical protein